MGDRIVISTGRPGRVRDIVDVGISAVLGDVRSSTWRSASIVYPVTTCGPSLWRLAPTRVGRATRRRQILPPVTLTGRNCGRSRAE